MKRITRLPAAVSLVVGGIIHLQLWLSGYRVIPYVGPFFIANVVVSALLALALVARNDSRVTVVAIIFSLASLVALVMSRTVGLFGFTEPAWTDQAVRATTAEFGAIVALAIVFVVTHRTAVALAPGPGRDRRDRRQGA
ncbi:MAG: hypothetical protein ACR2G7_09960 [Acidimicrobiales bacterium]